jgi:hypothetical protein
MIWREKTQKTQRHSLFVSFASFGGLKLKTHDSIFIMKGMFLLESAGQCGKTVEWLPTGPACRFL